MLPPKLKVLRKFGREPLQGRDFYELVDQNEIEFVISKDAQQGFYYFADGKHFIVLPSGLEQAERALTIWHEFSHFLQNFYNPRPAAAFCGVKENAPGEKLAKVFSIIARRPDVIRICGPMDFVKQIMRTKL
jgi:hypothetical protein